MQLLLESTSATLSKSTVEKLSSIVSDDTFSVKDLIDLSFHSDQQIGFRSAWILENVYSNYQKRFLPHTEYFLQKFSALTNLSALRHYVKILAFMTKKNASPEIKNILNNYDTENLVNVVFAWLIDDKIPVAVKSYCLNILANFIPKHPWLKNELIETMNFLVDKESIAFYAKVKQIRHQLK